MGLLVCPKIFKQYKQYWVKVEVPVYRLKKGYFTNQNPISLLDPKLISDPNTLFGPNC